MKKIIYLIIILFSISLVSCSKKEFEVKFIGINDEVFEIKNVSKDEAIIYPIAPEVEGYTFVKWSDSFEYIERDTVIKAIYEINKYTVKFYDSSNQVIDEQIITHNGNCSMPSTPLKEGFEFISWDKELNNIKSNLDVFPIYKQLTFTVNFYDEENNVIKTEEIKYGESCIAPNNIEKEGYDFLGWDKEFTNVKTNLDVKPILKVQTFTVNFYNANDDIIKTEIVEYGKNATAPNNPSKDECVFVGWDKEFSNIRTNLDIKPIFETKLFTVNFYDANNNIIKTEQVKENASCLAPSIPTKEGYKFVGWDKTFDNIKSNLDIYPIYEQLKFTVNFYDGSNVIISTEQVLYGESCKAPKNPIKEGHIFIGWDKEFNEVKNDLDIRPIFNILKFTVKFYDIDDKILKSYQVPYGDACPAPENPIKEGYVFVAWDTDFSEVVSNLDIRPVFDILTFKVTFYDASGNVLKTETVLYGESALGVEAPEKEGFRFIGWDEDYSEVKSDLDIYPIYEDFNYTVTFIDFYGNVLKTETVNENGSATAPNVPSVDYHTFVKWDLDFSEVKNNMTIKAIYTYNHTSYDIKNVNYWLQILSKKYDINKTILSSSEIVNYNTSITSSYAKTEVVDVLSIKGTKTSSYVSGLINAYANINKYTIYNKDTKVGISSTDKSNILANRNLNNIPSTVTVKYGIISDFAWMRSYPTNHYSNDYSMDRFQETSLNVGEGVVIYHESLDKEWYFVQAENYNGWIEKKYIAECTYDEMALFLKPNNNLIIISDYVTLESAHVRMGQSFPLVNSTNESYTISFPTRNNDGTLLFKELVVAKSNDYHEGYLDYTYKNVFTQAFKLLGIDYSWGDKDKLGRDCSSTMNAIYKCFGFMMPRNTSNQVAIPTYGAKVSGLTNSSVQKYKPGSMIFTSSHVMLYLGENENGIAYLLHNTTSGNGECILQSLNDYGGNRINGVLRLQ